MAFKLSLFLLLTASLNSAYAQAEYLLPDLTVSGIPLYDQQIDTSTIPGAKLLRFSNSTPNIGRGPLEIRGEETNSNGTQNVYQRIYKANGTSVSRLAGTFSYHPEHHHTHFADYASYKLRKVNFINGVGPVVAKSSKVSFCILDSLPFNPRLPGFSPLPKYRDCSNGVQGISVGWMDLYRKNLFDQWIDVTNVPKGRYWLESIVDPNNRLLESNERNNLTRVMIYLK